MQKRTSLNFIDGPEWALIEAPIPNAPEAKYISQIPSPTNLLLAASALIGEGLARKEDFKLYNFLKDRNPDVVRAKNIIYNMGEATCMDYLYDYAHAYLKLLRDYNPGSRIICIGYHTWLHADELRKKGFEVGNAHTFEDDILGYTTGKQWHNAWELNDWEWMHANVKSVTKGIRVTFRASRGCPHKCVMCPVTQTYESRVARNTVEWVMEEIDTLYHTHGVRQIGFLDDNLMFNRPWAKELLRRIIAKNYKGLSLTFEEGLDVPTALDEELLVLLKKAKFTHIKLGVESFNEDTLNFIKKPYRKAQMAIDAIKLLKKHKLSPVCFICIGFPNDTEESIRKDIKTLLDLKVKLRVQILWAYPGVTFQGKGLSAETLKQLQRDAMYGSNSVAWRKKPKPAKQDVVSLPL